MESLCDDDAVIIERTRRTEPTGRRLLRRRQRRERFSLSARLTSARIYVGAKRVLVVDLNLETAGHLRDAFGREGCELRHASSCSEAIALAESWDPCLILLDVSVSELAGLGFVDRFRAHSSAAIIVLSARESESETAPGFDHGADDFLHKPFKLDELLACARSALRIRSAKQSSARAHALGSLTIDEVIGAVELRGQPVRCSPKELLTLQCLANANGRVLSNHELINRVWGPGSPQRAYHLRVFIGRLRAKIEEDPRTPKLLLTERGLGHRLARDLPVSAEP
jgi:two-component system, OmpR family, KDP operon response regulator KdpE